MVAKRDENSTAAAGDVQRLAGAPRPEPISPPRVEAGVANMRAALPTELFPCAPLRRMVGDRGNEQRPRHAWHLGIASRPTWSEASTVGACKQQAVPVELTDCPLLSHGLRKVPRAGGSK